MNNEHREQNEALRNNVQHMYKQHGELQSEIDSLKGQKDRLEDRIVEMKKREIESKQFKDKVDSLLRELTESNETESNPAKDQAITLYNQLFPDNTVFQNSNEINTTTNEGDAEANTNAEEQKSKEAAPDNATQVTTSSADQDLLNNIARLEQQIQEQQKKFDTEKDNLEQQLVVWKEKTRMKQDKVQDVEQERQEIEKELNSLKNIEIELRKNVAQLEQKIVSCQQQIEKSKKDNETILSKLSEREQERKTLLHQVEELNQKHEKSQTVVTSTQRQLQSANDMREQFRKEIVEANRKIKQLEPFVEKANRFDQLEQAHQQLVTQHQSLQKQHQKLQNQEITVRNARDSLQDQLKNAESKSKVLQRDIDRLVQEKQEIIDKAKEYVKEMNERDSQQETIIKQLRTKQSQIERGQQKAEELLIGYFVSQTLSEWASRTVSQEMSTITQELKDIRDKEGTLKEDLETATRERDDLQQQLKDKRTEYMLQMKKSKQVAQELRNQVSQLQSQLKDGVEKKPLLVRQQSFDTFSEDSPRLSLTRAPSMPGTPVTNNDGRRLSFSSDISSGPSELEQQIMKENNQLIQRVADLQNSKWVFEERCRMLDENLMILKEELEKKMEIIQYYVSREKVGRIAPEQERFNQTHQPKGLSQGGGSTGGFMSSLFSSSATKSKPQITPTVDAYNHMQQVMQETLLHNIQLQKDIKTLGDEIARLLNEQKQQKTN